MIRSTMSKSLAVLAFGVVAGASVAQAQTPFKEFEFSGYMRAGTGWSTLGGRQQCFGNAGTPGNEFRLGNECGIYGEAKFKAGLMKKTNASDPFFLSGLTLAYFPHADSQYEDSDVDADKRDINVVEAYVEGGNVDGIPMTFWVGKRFYRSADIHMNDWYYFANMSGTGGGVSNIDTGFGLLKVAILQETALTDTFATNPNTARTRISTTSGDLGKTALDVQLEQLKVTDADFLHLWAVGAVTPPGYQASTTTSYQAANGYVAGVRHTHKLADGENNIAIAYGKGVMESLELSGGGAAVTDVSTIKDASRIRFVEHLTTKIGDRMATHFAATYEIRDNGAANNPKTTWWNVGIRPVYFFTDHFHLVAEAGRSTIKADGADERTLTRVTLAPEIGIEKNIFGRPVLRAFVSHSMWSDSNKGNMGVAYADKTSGTSLGVQTEVWF